IRILLGDVVELVRFARPVPGVVVGIRGAIQRGRSVLVQDTQQTRQRIVAEARIYAVGLAQSRQASQRVVAKRELPSQRAGQLGEAVQSVILVSVGRTVRRRERRPVGGGIVAVGVAERSSGQERVLRRGPDQPPHVVIGESVCPRGIGRLLDLARQI